MVEVSLVLVGGFEAPVPVLDDGVKKVLENRIGLLITSHTAHGHDEGVTWGVKGRSEVLVTHGEDLGSWVQCRLCVHTWVCVCVRVCIHARDFTEHRGSELRRLRVGRNGERRLGEIEAVSGGGR